MSGQTEQALVLGVALLAAGRSTRMGQPKMLLPWSGTTVVGHLIRQWTGLGAAQVAVVCAADDHLLAAELDRLSFPCANRISNPVPERGMFSSIQCAARWSGWAPALTHWMLVLGDQPHIGPATLQALLEFGARNSTLVCQPSRAGRPRHPVLLPKAIFSAVGSSAAENLKQFLSAHRTVLCEIDDPGLEMDIDRPEDYERALKLCAEPSIRGTRKE